MMPGAVCITGFTGIGKSEIAVELAESLDGEIVNADSRQVFKGLDVGTAKPSIELRSRVPHHLYDVAGIDEVYSIGLYVRRARATVAQILERKRCAIVVGGPGLYLVSLVFGYEVPEVEPNLKLRAELVALADTEGLEALRQRLAHVDPGALDLVDLNNPRRVIRAIEVSESGPRRFSEIARRATPPEWPIYELQRPEAELVKRIERRTSAMFESGILAEARLALDRGAEVTSPGLTGIGYAEAISVVRGELDISDAVAAVVRATVRLVRRQKNWLKRLRPSPVRVSAGGPEVARQLNQLACEGADAR